MLVVVYSDVAVGENARAETRSWVVFKMPQMLFLNKNGWIIFFIMGSALWFYKVHLERAPFMLVRLTNRQSMIRKIVFIYRNYILM